MTPLGVGERRELKREPGFLAGAAIQWGWYHSLDRDCKSRALWAGSVMKSVLDMLILLFFFSFVYFFFFFLFVFFGHVDS